MKDGWKARGVILLTGDSVGGGSALKKNQKGHNGDSVKAPKTFRHLSEEKNSNGREKSQGTMVRVEQRETLREGKRKRGLWGLSTHLLGRTPL